MSEPEVTAAPSDAGGVARRRWLAALRAEIGALRKRDRQLDQERQQLVLLQELQQLRAALQVKVEEVKLTQLREEVKLKQLRHAAPVLAALDDRLAEALSSGAIRLLRSAWLLQQPAGYRMQRRQDLEALERRGTSLSPLLSTKEAVTLLGRGNRSVGVLSYGWLSAGNPDPAGVRVTVLRRALELHIHIEAIFWDFASLYQGDRTEKEQRVFSLALAIMGDLYASAIGTTVLQDKTIPPRPPEFDGALCLFNLRDGVDKKAIETELRRFGTITSCELRPWPHAVVRFSAHAAAIAAKAAAAELSMICDGIDTLYNERPYDERGWCCFEENVSRELLTRLANYPRLRDVLEPLPAKLLALHSDKAPEPVELAVSEVGNRRARVIEQIEAAKFTGKGDKAKVKETYKEYASNVVTKMQATFGMFQAAQADVDIPSALHMPMISIEALPPLHLAEGQLLICRREGGGSHFGVVDASGHCVVRMLDGSSAELVHDACVQEALPWSVPADERGAEALREIGWLVHKLYDEAELLSAMTTLGLEAPKPPDEGRLTRLRKSMQALVDAASKLPAVAEVARAAYDAVQEPLEAAIKLLQEATKTPCEEPELDGEKSRELAENRSREIAEKMDRVRKAIAELVPQYELVAYAHEKLEEICSLIEAIVNAASKLQTIAEAAHAAAAEVKQTLESVTNLIPSEVENKLLYAAKRVRTVIAQLGRDLDPKLTAALRATASTAMWRYAVGQPLLVRTPDGAWHAAEVVGCEQGGRHQLHFGDGGGSEDTILALLHPWNHAPCELPLADFEELRAWHVASARKQHSHIADALSGRRLETLKQCVAIDVIGGDTSMAVRDAYSLAAWLTTLHKELLAGGACERPPAALLTAGPAAGKTTQLMALLSQRGGGDDGADGELVPILIKVQRLQRRLLEAPDAFAAAWNYIDAFLRLELTEMHYRLLRQAMLARRAVLLLDGLDEAGAKRAEIEAHVAQVLAPQGHVLLCTSRPAGVSKGLFDSFRRLRLSPLTEAQQEEALTQRLGAARAVKLLQYVRESIPRDAQTGEKVTANPLMLSMVASVFELRGDIQMPTTVAELYKQASDAMLARGRASSDAVRRLLKRVFFEAHVAQRRVIEDWQLDEAALGLERSETLAAIRKRLMTQTPIGPSGSRLGFLDAVGHYVEVITGQHAGRRGVISTVLSTTDLKIHPFKVTFADGQVSRWLERSEFNSSGLDETAFLRRGMAISGGAQVREACSRLLPDATREMLAEVRRRVARDELPLLSLLQIGPLQLQASHLSFQEYFAASSLSEDEGLVVSGTPPWQWPVWWANAVTIGGGMDGFGKGLVRAAQVEGSELDLSSKLGGHRPTVLLVVKALCGVLRSLDLSSNELDAEEGKMLVEAVSLSSSIFKMKIDGYALPIRQLKGTEPVKLLDLSNKKFSMLSAMVITSLIRNNPSVTSLSLGQNELGDEGATLLARALKESKVSKLASLNLNGYGCWRKNQIGPAGAKELAKYISVAPSLTELSISGNSIGDDGKYAIGAAVSSSMRRLVCDNLDLQADATKLGPGSWRQWGLGPGDAALIAGGLRAFMASIISLSLGDNNFGDEGVQALSVGLKESKSLVTLNLSNQSVFSTQFGTKGAAALASAIAVIPSVTSLSTAYNKITGDGAQQLASAVLAKPTLENFSGIPLKKLRADSLTALNLSEKGLGVPEAMVLADLLRSVTASLTDLNLCMNTLMDEGVIALADSLKQNSTITSLNIAGGSGTSLVGGIGVTPKGIMALAEALKVNGSLTSLSLAENELGDDGAVALSIGLKENRSLTTLDLRGTSYGDGIIGPRGATALASAIAVIPSLMTVNLDGYALPVKKLKGTEPVESLDFSRKEIGITSAIVIASLIGGNDSLTKIS